MFLIGDLFEGLVDCRSGANELVIAGLVAAMVVDRLAGLVALLGEGLFSNPYTFCIQSVSLIFCLSSIIIIDLKWHNLVINQMGQQGLSSSPSQYTILHSSGNLHRAIHSSKRTSHILQTIPTSPYSHHLARLQKRQHPPSQLTHMQHHFTRAEKQFCGRKQQHQVVWEQAWPTLEEYINLRRREGRGFKKDEIESVIRAGVLGLREVREMGEQHGTVDLKAIVIGERQVVLKDPMIVEEERRERRQHSRQREDKRMEGYPSPQKIRTYFDSLSLFQEHSSDLFSLGVVALQMCHPQRDMRDIYRPPNPHYLNLTIDRERLEVLLRQVRDRELREKIGVLVGVPAKGRLGVEMLIAKETERRKTFTDKVEGLIYEEEFGRKDRQQVIVEPFYKKEGGKIKATRNPVVNLQIPPVVPFQHTQLSSVAAARISLLQRPDTAKSIIVSPPTQVSRHANTLPFPPLQQPSPTDRIDPPQPHSLPTPNLSKPTPIPIPSVATHPSTIPSSIAEQPILLMNPQEGNPRRRDGRSSTIINQLQSTTSETQQEENRHQPNNNSNLEQKPKEYAFKNITESMRKHSPKYMPAIYNQSQFTLQPNNAVERENSKPISPSSFRPANHSPSKEPPHKKDSAVQIQLPPQESPELPSVTSPNPIENPLSVQTTTEQTLYETVILKGEYLPTPNKEPSSPQKADHSSPTNSLIDGLGHFSAQKDTIAEPEAHLSPAQLETQSDPTQPPSSDPAAVGGSTVDGYVVEEYEIGTRYEGYKRNGMRNGQGEFVYKEGSKYRGEWRDNKMEGYGTLYYPNGQVAYEGEWKNDEFDGKGVVYNDAPCSLRKGFDYTNFNSLDEEWISYQGELRRDSKEGVGILLLTNGEVYEGEFHGDMVHGEGMFKRLNGTLIKGCWQEGKLKKINHN